MSVSLSVIAVDQLRQTDCDRLDATDPSIRGSHSSRSSDSDRSPCSTTPLEGIRGYRSMGWAVLFDTAAEMLLDAAAEVRRIVGCMLAVVHRTVGCSSNAHDCAAVSIARVQL